MHPQGKRFLVVLLALGILAFFLARDQQPAKDDEPVDPGVEEIRIPLPKAPDPEPLHEQARGVYQLDAPGARVSLELMRGRRFRFLSTRGDEQREASGTWSLTGNRLVLAYKEIGGKPVGEEPMVVANVWTGRTIELKDTGLPGRVVLTKRAMIRQR
ncbi:MAG: hypothetical protein QNJ90_16265 [Planctomycetota bacterium]|nr:hypothetical protein [Planctomycetota bacterium]